MSRGPVFWQQGLFLQPQHFQYSDMRGEELLGRLASVARPWMWGVQQAQVDLGALAGGTFALSAFSGFFPESGLRLYLPGNAACAGRVIPKEIVPVGERLPVYLALGVLRPEGGNAAIADSVEELLSLSCRYGVLTGQEVMPDLYEQGAAAQVKRMTVILRVIFGPEREDTQDAVLLPVARLVRGSDSFELDESYSPPCLVLEDSALLTAVVREVRDRIVGKTRQMDSYKSLVFRGGQVEQIGLLMILRSLSRYAARFEHFANTPKISPWDAYLLLRETVAELSVFSRDYNPLGEDQSGNQHILPYEHTDPAPCFVALRDIIVRLIDGLSTGPKYMIRLEYRQPLWQADLPQHIFDDPQSADQYWLVLRSNTVDLSALGPARLALIKVGPARSMQTLLAHAVPGMPFTPESNTPMGLPRQKGTVYLALHRDAAMWDDLVEQGGICLDWKEAPSDLEVHFAVLGG